MESDTLPFIPEEFKYEVIPAVVKQFRIVSDILNREDVERIYVCTDSGGEGEYIYRLVEQQAHVTRKNVGECGSILRRRKRFFGGSARRKIFRSTTI